MARSSRNLAAAALTLAASIALAAGCGAGAVADAGRATPTDGSVPPTTDGWPVPDDSLPACRLDGAPASLGAGFTDLTKVIDQTPPFPVRGLTDNGGPDPTVGLFADLDGDGHVETILADYWKGDATYHYQAGVGLVRYMDPFLEMGSGGGTLLGALDLDGDGRVDVVRANEVVFYDAVKPVAVPLRPMRTFCVGDFDGDGWLDLITADDCCDPGCNDVRPMLRRAPRQYADRGDLVTEGILDQPFAMLCSPVGPGDTLIVTIGNTCPNVMQSWTVFAPGSYVVGPPASDGYPRITAFDPLPPRPFFIHGTPPPNAPPQPITGSSPMGGVVGDADGDGRFDLLLSLGDFSPYRGTPTWPLLDESARWGPTLEYWNKEGVVTPWGVALVDLDRDGRPDLVTVHGNDEAGWIDPVRRNTPEWTSVHWNAGDFCFVDVTKEAGDVARPGQWQSLAVGDVDGDGDADLIVGGQGELPRVYRNDVALGHGFTLRLQGTTSNHLGVGARVDVEVAGLPAQHFIVGGTGSPWIVSEPLVFASTGAALAADLVRVTWPSGVVQELEGVASDQVQRVTEPALIAIDPADRQLPADGKSVAKVHVTPRDPDGSARAAKVTIAVRYGAPATVGPVAPDGDGYTATVTAPSAPGSTAIEVTIDGAPSPIRPRLWWN